MIKFSEFHELLLEGGAVGHMAHPFDLPQVKTGTDLINIFNKMVDSLTNNPGSIKIDGANTSVKLIDTVEGGKEFALDRGSMKDLDVRGVTNKQEYLKQRFQTKDGSDHGMWTTGSQVLTILNQAIPAIEPELKKLGMWKDKDIIINMEHVGGGGTANVQDYSEIGNFLAFHGLNKFEQVTPRRRASNEIKYSKPAMNKMIEKIQPIAAEHGFKIFGDVPTTLDKDIDFTQALSERITVRYTAEQEEIRTLQGWLTDAKNPKGQNISLVGGGKDTAMTKKMYKLVVYGIWPQGVLRDEGTQPVKEGVFVHEIVDPKDVGWVISGAMIYHATRTLGNVVLAEVGSEIGSANTQEGVVIRDKSISNKPVKITGEFIVRGETGIYAQAAGR